MPKEKPDKKAVKLRHEPLQRQIEQKNGKLKEPKVNRHPTAADDEEEEEKEEVPSKAGLKSASRVAKDADMTSFEEWGDEDEEVRNDGGDEDEEEYEEEEYEEGKGDDEEEEFVELDGENFAAAGVSESEVR